MKPLHITRPNLQISFSGGRTSAVMLRLLVPYLREHHPKLNWWVVFANTGQEHPATYDFVRDVADWIGVHVVWLEAVVNPEQGKGIRHKVVTYETASRDGRPFRDVIAKYGVPNPANPQCTSRLKTEVFESYSASIGVRSKDRHDAIGIRADEIDRIPESATAKGLLYPMAHWGWTRAQVRAETAGWPFDLRIPGDHYGNCVWCWKKSLRKLLTVAREQPQWFNFPAEMERLYGTHKAFDPQGEYDLFGTRHERRFFRGNRSAGDIIELARTGNFKAYSDAELDESSGCSESCEIGTEEAEREQQMILDFTDHAEP